MSPIDPAPVAVLAHGAGSAAGFLVRAFPADRLGVAGCRYPQDRTGSVDAVVAGLRRAAESVDGPVLLGGLSLGAHAAATLLTSPDCPANIIAGLLCLPAWSGAPGPVAAMTAAAAAAIASLGIEGVLAELDASDWVTAELADAWAQRDSAGLARELSTAADQAAPVHADLQRIRVPVGIVVLSDDPLHPATEGARWAAAIPRAGLAALSRDEPAEDRAVFADCAANALARAMGR